MRIAITIIPFAVLGVIVAGLKFWMIGDPIVLAHSALIWSAGLIFAAAITAVAVLIFWLRWKQ